MLSALHCPSQRLSTLGRQEAGAEGVPRGFWTERWAPTRVQRAPLVYSLMSTGLEPGAVCWCG